MSEKHQNNLSHSKNKTEDSAINDIEHLLSQYNNGLQKYHEICHQNSIHDIRKRWPLLQEIGSSDVVKQGKQ